MAKGGQAVTNPSSEPKPGGRVLDVLKAWLPIVTVAVGGAWGVFVYFDNRPKPAPPPAVAAPAIAADLEKQKLATFTEVSELAATLANTPVGTEAWTAAETRFWTLYDGPMSMHEKGEVENRMVKFGHALKARKAEPTDDTAADLREASLKLAHALRDELAPPPAKP